MLDLWSDAEDDLAPPLMFYNFKGPYSAASHAWQEQ